MSRYPDIDPMDIDPETGRPYANYSSPALDTSFHDHEMAGEEDEDDLARRAGIAACAAGAPISSNPFKGGDRTKASSWDYGWREEHRSELAERRAEVADDFGPEAADEYGRES